VPPGAEVIGPDHNIAGRTPLRMEMPIASTPVVIELRLAGYRTRTKELVVSGDSGLEVELERMPQMPTQPVPKKPPSTGNELIRPEDM
jgi:hypothetical protein